MERALLVAIRCHGQEENWTLQDIADELQELVHSCGVEVIDTVTCVIDRPTANLYIGSGKAEEIGMHAYQVEADVVIFSADLSGTQQRNLENIIGRKTIDRTQLILDIFARRARSPEGKMQVELAQLQYLLPRLIGKGVILSRMGGGIGSRGPGEQKLELDRRRIRARIDRLKDDLRSVQQHRELMRKKRRENAVPSIALVGYTSAGKSTLLNSLTGSEQEESQKLFTTLDPLSKSLKLPNGETVVISDTVGFLHDLPHHLIEAFKATLEEVQKADLLLHVLDVQHSRASEHYWAVVDVLEQLECAKKPAVTVLNKIDLLEDKSWLPRFLADFPNAVGVSARTGENFEGLFKKLESSLQPSMELVEWNVPHGRMDLINRIYESGRVISIEYLPDGVRIKANLPKAAAIRLSNFFN